MPPTRQTLFILPLSWPDPTREADFLRGLCRELLEEHWDFARGYEAMRHFPGYARLADIPQGATVCIYGAGAAGRHLLARLRQYRPDVTVARFLDTFTEGETEGVPIARYDTMDGEALHGCFVLLASAFWREILENMGETIRLEHVRIFDPAPTVKYALVLPRAKMLFVPVPKSACTSVSIVLLDYEGISQSLMHKLEQPVDLCDPQYRDYFKFSFVRHPWARLYSTYCAMGANLELRSIAYIMGRIESDFETFARFVANNSDLVADVHWRSQHTFFLDDEGKSLVDFVGRFEMLRDDFEVVRERLGTTLSLPHLYKSKRPINAGERPWATVAATCDRYARDMELFNYA